DAATPEPGPGQLRLAVSHAGVGLPDLLMCRDAYMLTPALPFTPGQEVVGTVTAAGEGTRHAVGDRVMAVSAFFLQHGSFAEACLALDDFALPVPDTMPGPVAAGFVIPAHTAWVGLVQRGALRAGETLLVLGASGGTGSVAASLGKALGARVIATAGGSEKAAFVESLGVDVVIDHRRQGIAEAVREATDGRGVDIVYDPVGGDAFTAATRCIAREGRLLLIGFASGRWGEPRPPHMVERNYSVIGVMPNGYDRKFKEDAHAALLEHWSAGRLQIPIHEIFPFERVPDAIGVLAERGAQGKIVVEVAPA
ncbi:MAG: NADPH:quinone oxidoreductase family protein, partial [Deltaproteobacteria bacterium]|nr:NADPH:quinone oxidoreductase family protein [Deltaproteobacteria bacterium]